MAHFPGSPQFCDASRGTSTTNFWTLGCRGFPNCAPRSLSTTAFPWDWTGFPATMSTRISWAFPPCGTWIRIVTGIPWPGANFGTLDKSWSSTNNPWHILCRHWRDLCFQISWLMNGALEMIRAACCPHWLMNWGPTCIFFGSTIPPWASAVRNRNMANNKG